MRSVLFGEISVVWWDQCCLVGSVLFGGISVVWWDQSHLISFLYCVFLSFVLCSMLPVSLDYSFMIVHSIFSNVY